jgi:type III pantothenate kinase
MLLCIDAGNSGIKIALTEGVRIVARHRCDLKRNRQPSFNALFPASLRHFRAELEGAVVSSVVPGLNSRLRTQAERLTGTHPLFLGAGVKLPFSLRLTAPGRVGSDRLAAAAGAARRARQGAFIIDIGSAITVDLLSRGAFRGGIIMAGPALALLALGDRTANLPQIDFYAGKGAFPRRFNNTHSSLVLGAGIGAVGAIKEALNELARHEGRRLPIYLTGGAVPCLKERIPAGWRYDPDLVIQGLSLVWRLNRKRTE